MYLLQRMHASGLTSNLPELCWAIGSTANQTKQTNSARARVKAKRQSIKQGIKMTPIVTGAQTALRKSA
jgi:hypothetical protein